MYQDELKPYKGYKLDFDLDIEPEECVKIFHTLVKPDGTRENIDFSPYFNRSQAAFQAWIDQGFPPARKFGRAWEEKEYKSRKETIA